MKYRGKFQTAPNLRLQLGMGKLQKPYRLSAVTLLAPNGGN